MVYNKERERERDSRQKALCYRMTGSRRRRIKHFNTFDTGINQTYQTLSKTPVHLGKGIR